MVPGGGKERALAGVEGHKILQADRPEGYRSEVALSHTLRREGVQLEITGRIDGIYMNSDPVIIEEIKTAICLPETPWPRHSAQLVCYAWMYTLANDLPEVETRLVYLETVSGKVQTFPARLTAGDLASRVEELLIPYCDWLRRGEVRMDRRDRSLDGLSFPYRQFRRGQREMAEAVYRGICQGGLLFGRAPTGTGKTMAALFSAVKAVGRGKCRRIFYLTARTTGRMAVEKALAALREQGMYLVHVTLTAKDKICFSEGENCDPFTCAYTRGYYDRLPGALAELDSYSAFDRPLIEELARRHRLCPFEYSLDLALSADCIVCDYNYVFDPRVYLKRFFAYGKTDAYLLIDEAHNMPDRARSMFSASLGKRIVLDLKRGVGKAVTCLYPLLDAINKLFIEKRKLCQESGKGFLISTSIPGEWLELLREFSDAAGKWLEENPVAEAAAGVREFYFAVLHFLKTAEYFSAQYVMFFSTASRGDLQATLFCLDPAPRLESTLKICRGAFFFSATLLPLAYFKRVLGGGMDDPEFNLPSPFPAENLGLFVMENIATAYRQRAASCMDVAGILAAVFNANPGPYLVYFPSYAYLNQVADVFLSLYSDIPVILQAPGMGEEERESFLARFESEPPPLLCGFAVMGGIFGEGIDLVGDKLKGVVVVGVGLPQLCPERDLIRDYFAEQGRNGFAYAYRNPGFNKVLQAAGRVIRTEEDRGVVVLIDARFSREDYRKLFPEEWQHASRPGEEVALKRALAAFWECR